MSPIPFGGRLVRGVRRPVKPYTPKDPQAPGITIGFDTETIQDIPNQRASLYTIQLYAGAPAKTAEVTRCDDAGDAWRTIIRFLRARKHRPDDGPVVVWAFNLNFDLLWLFGSSTANRRMLAGGSYFGARRELDADGARIGVQSFVYGAVSFAEIHHEGYQFLFRDLSLFWPGTLAQLGQRMGYAKAPRPSELGTRRYLDREPDATGQYPLAPQDGPEAKAFVRYARRDAIIAYRAGQAAREALIELGVWSYKHVPASAAHAASLLFRSKLPSPVPPPRTFPALRAALFAFAGGRAGSRVRGAYPREVHAFDVNSMYPAAMLELPEPGGWAVTTVRKWAGPDAIYLVDGRCDDTRWPGLVERDRYGRLWPLVGEFRGVWVTGYELESFWRWGDGEITIRYGHHYQQTRPRTTFPAFVGALYPLRSHENPLISDLAKTMLNGLSGKFIEIHSRFALPRGLKIRVPAPVGDGYYLRSDGRMATDPNGLGVPIEIIDEWADGPEARDFDSYMGTLISALMDGDYQEIKRLSGKAAEGSRVIEVNMEYAQHDTGRTFAPELATLILGKARARLHDLMHEHKAVYWDTDSVMTEDRDVPTGSGIGELKHEGSGMLTVARPKLYAIRAGRKVVKLAASGYPDRLAQATKLGIVDGTVTEYDDARAISPRTTRDRTMRDVGTFYPVAVSIEHHGDDPRTKWTTDRADREFEWATPRPLPFTMRGLGRLRYV